MKKAFLIFGIFVVFALFLSEYSFGKEVKSPKISKKYIYKVVPLTKISNLEDFLNKYGANGWRFVQLDGSTGNIILENEKDVRNP